MRKLLVVAAILLASLIPMAKADAAKVDCTVLLFKPTWFWQDGMWSPKSLRGTNGTQDWFNRCQGRFKVKKKNPDVRPGHWYVHVTLDPTNCSYHADENLKDWGWWKEARIVVT